MINSTNSGFQQINNGLVEKYCYDKNPANCEIYGGLYEWAEAMQYNTTAGTQVICPPGWHIPTTTELRLLNVLVSYDGNALKAIEEGTEYGVGTNTSGFFCLVGGSP